MSTITRTVFTCGSVSLSVNRISYGRLNRVNMEAKDLERTFWRNVWHIALGLIVVGLFVWGLFIFAMYALYKGWIGP